MELEDRITEPNTELHPLNNDTKILLSTDKRLITREGNIGNNIEKYEVLHVYKLRSMINIEADLNFTKNYILPTCHA